MAEGIINMAEGVIVNTFTTLEPRPLKALQEKQISIYPVRPIIQIKSGSTTTTDEAKRHECMKWLDEQPRGSVSFVSFGSGGTLSHEQIIELALGLKMSDQRFLWVVRCPNKTTSNVNFFNIQSQNDPLAYMPKGFLERTKVRGFMLPFWASQAEILAHECICGLLTYCGWNSTLESMFYGVPLIAWPLYAEQKMNAILLSEDLKVALRVNTEENGAVVRRVDIMNVVKGLIEGEDSKRLRNRMKNLKDTASMTLSDDGSSTKALSMLASKWNKKTFSSDVKIMP